VKPINIFKTGTHTSAQSTTLEFSELMLQASAEAYDSDLHEAPIVIGHPKSNGPAYGWIKDLAFAEGSLDAEPQQVNADFAEMVTAGAFKKVSASFYGPDAPSNPVPGTFYLRHVGFLGAQPPAIKGLKEIAFSEGEEGVVEFSGDWETASFLRNFREWLISKFGKEDADEVVPSYMVESLEDAVRHPGNEATIEPAYTETIPEDTTMPMTPEEIEAAEAALNARKALLDTREASFSERETAIAEMKAREAAADAKETAFSERETTIAATEQAQAKQAIAVDVEKLIAEGKVLPAEKGKLVNFMASIDAEHVFEFAEGGQTHSEPARDYLLGLLTSQPKRVDFNEHTKDEEDDQEPDDAKTLANKALSYKEAQAKAGREMTITQAVADVMAGKAE
jgi:hypothetical protein